MYCVRAAQVPEAVRAQVADEMAAIFREQDEKKAAGTYKARERTLSRHRHRPRRPAATIANAIVVAAWRSRRPTALLRSDLVDI